jgi:hypothetical protein
MGLFMSRISVAKASIALVFFICLTSCEDFFVRDLSGDSVTLVSPSNGVTTILQTQEFVWDEMKGAENYQLQIAFPSFAAIQYFVLDTTISKTKFTFTLEPGIYEWRVRAKNFGGYSLYSSPFQITIDTTSDLSQQVVALNAPVNGKATNDSTPSFSWQSVYAATSYNIIIKNGSSWSSGSVVYNDTVSTNSLTLALADYLSEGTYVWGVRALNAISYTQSFSTHLLYVDVTNPPVVTLVSPSQQSSQSAGFISFSWTRSTDLGNSPTARTDSLYIFSDTTNLTVFDRIGSSGTSASLSITATGWYKWFVVSYDQAGNPSDTSTQRTFQVN